MAQAGARDRMSRITLITSLYKGGKHIEAFLNNVTQQTAWEDCDLFIVDANSPDHEYEVIKDDKKLNHIAFVIHKGNLFIRDNT